MLPTMLFTFLPLLAAAAYLDPSLQQQKPLLDSKPVSSRVLTLTQLDQNLDYTFTASDDDFTRTRLDQLQGPLVGYGIKEVVDHAITINIPLNSSLKGTATFSNTRQAALWPQSTDQFTWTPQLPLRTLFMLGARISILDIGIRKDGMLTMPAESATLDLSTPYIYVPKGIWDVLLLATTTEQQARDGEEVLYVDCGALNVFPDLVFGMAPSECGGDVEMIDDDDDDDENEEYDEEEEEDYGELVITPEQNADSRPIVPGTQNSHIIDGKT
ncbi:hypothetical protein J4E93_002853 [Alternaria ventricosa]|uniref:uncharacterized protein n=1 Tax=Alternaria ventricosa TaxID=1187951 RepID=UPI0020C31383|nr:uncharacterized protein J4E93_002853 [Alternaria ventricosa]KAI4650497.1 hypothetical protein J4E93_002853 [Alternaria ventricosa]